MDIKGGVTMNIRKELNKILELHRKFLDGDNGGKRADLSGADLRWADLGGANLRGADLSGANLSGADLRGADLSGANLREANLNGANLIGANLSGAALLWANLSGADLRGADLRGADLSGANLIGANLIGANLSGANLPNYKIMPEEGSFIAWKKVNGGFVIKLQIPEEARRVCSLSGRKIRVSKAIPIAAYSMDKKSRKRTFYGKYDREFIYKIGKEVFPDKFDEDIRIECTHGIHCFITKQEALLY